MAPSDDQKKTRSSPSASSASAPKKQVQFSISSFMPNFQGSVSPVSTSSRSPPKPKTKTSVSAPRTAITDKGKSKVIVIDDSDDEEEAKLASSGKDDEGVQQWVDRYGPTCKDDLGVHPKKVLDVEHWFQEAFDSKLGKYRRLLVLSGPSGSAKTATLRVLAKELDVDILEYRNPANFSFAGETQRESLVDHFIHFLSRAGMAPALELVSDSLVASTSSSKPSFPPPSQKDQKRLILMEDLPNISHYPTKLAFRSALQQYLASPRVTCPLVVIVSEALSRPGVAEGGESTTGFNRLEESVDARSVCGIEVLQAAGCREIQFNPVAVTIMKKALVKILDRAYSASSSSSSDLSPSSRPSTQTLEVIITHSNGDIRSALNMLEFLATNPSAVKGVTNLAAGPEGAKKGKKRGSDGKVKGASEDQVRNLLQYVTARESSLFLFHALGKVLYSKRWGISEADDKKDIGRAGVKQKKTHNKLPPHLRQQWDRAPSKVDPDVMFAEAPIDSDIFLSYIHHNYTAFTNKVEECCGIMEGMSDADSLMRMEGDEWLRRAALTSQYSFNVAVRSTLVCLPTPVPHRKQVLRKSELWENLRLTRANEADIDDLYRRSNELAIVPPWPHKDGEEPLGGCQRSKRSLLTELVPYAGAIARKRYPAQKNLFTTLATFPPVPTSTHPVFVKGEALDEKVIEVEEDLEEPGEEEDEERAEEEKDMEDIKPAEELLYDPEDDIED
ncbi:Rad17-domain-containing protein [Meredithblackwellia eburnea MCA 4105]